MYMYVYVCICMYLYVFVCICMYMYVYVCMCMCMCMYIRTYVCIDPSISIHTSIHPATYLPIYLNIQNNDFPRFIPILNPSKIHFFLAKSPAQSCPSLKRLKTSQLFSTSICTCLAAKTGEALGVYLTAVDSMHSIFSSFLTESRYSL